MRLVMTSEHRFFSPDLRSLEGQALCRRCQVCVPATSSWMLSHVRRDTEEMRYNKHASAFLEDFSAVGSTEYFRLWDSVGSAQARMKLKHLESALSSVTKYSDLGADNVNIELEQYSTSAHLAARMVYTAEFEFGDIEGRNVLDLGCGTGMLGIAAGMLGAGSVVGVDVDAGALTTAAENASEMDVELDLVCCDVARSPCIPGRYDTVLMNPPFGTRKAGIDVVFLERALEAASTAVYSMHKSSTRKHLLKKAEQWSVDIDVLAQLRFDIPATYKFHKRDSVDVEADLIRLQKR